MPYRTFRFNECACTSLLFKLDKGINDWLAKHKEWNAFSSAASFGLIHHWNANSLNTWGSLSQSNNSAFINGWCPVGQWHCVLRHPWRGVPGACSAHGRG
ncbi:hypothetical protein niasHS_000834 [Heterodera schachtii]|uniref:Uncharacterized protein n=1 Tax=Heterodera schachtii TaxID=97005 RepID=A0ABD2KMK1_HETSC